MPVENNSIVILVLGPAVIMALVGAFVWWLRARTGGDGKPRE